MRRTATATKHESPDAALYERLAKRLGRVHIRQRLSLESEYERHVFRRGTHFFHLENWYSVHGLIRTVLRLSGLHGRGQRNARRLRLVRNEIKLAGLPRAFDGYTLLHLSDLHLDMGGGFVEKLIERVHGLEYDLAVLTGDFRYRTYGAIEPTIEVMARLRPHLRKNVYAVLGNHDSLRMVPPLEDMGVRALLNESVTLKRRGASIWLAGIDDAHYYRADNLHKAAHDIPRDALAILLSHTPEAYRNAAHAGFRLMLCGHTHGGQICLPGGIPVMIDADCPRRYARGAWRYRDLVGYTSVGAGSSIVDVRINNRPEVTLHVLRAAQ